MQASSTSPDQKAVVAQLQAEAQVVFVQPNQGAAQQGQPQARSKALQPFQVLKLRRC